MREPGSHPAGGLFVLTSLNPKITGRHLAQVPVSFGDCCPALAALLTQKAHTVRRVQVACEIPHLIQSSIPSPGPAPPADARSEWAAMDSIGQ